MSPRELPTESEKSCFCVSVSPISQFKTDKLETDLSQKTDVYLSKTHQIIGILLPRARTVWVLSTVLKGLCWSKVPHVTVRKVPKGQTRSALCFNIRENNFFLGFSKQHLSSREILDIY